MARFSRWIAQIRQWYKQEKRAWLVVGSVAGSIVLLRWVGLFQPIELAALDTLFWTRPLGKLEDRILIVGIDEDDIQKVDRWPIPDKVLAELLWKLQEHQPSAIGIDIYRDLPTQPGQEELEKAFREIPNVVGIEQLEDKDSLGVKPPSALAEQGMVGFNNVVVDADGKVRRSLFYWQTADGNRTSFALMLALIYLEARDISPQTAPNGRDLRLGDMVFELLDANEGGYVRLDNRGYQILCNFRHPSRFTQVKMSDVLDGKVPAELIRDRVVAIGYTAPSLKDTALIPYSTNWFGSAKPIYGVELHANFISQVMSGAMDGRSPLNSFPDWAEVLWIFLWSGIGAVLIIRGRSVKRSTLYLIGLFGTLWGVAYGSFLAGYWIPFVPAVLALAGSVGVLTIYLAHQQEELKRSKEFLQSTINAIPDPVFVKNKDHVWIILNHAFSQFLGYPLEDLLGKTDFDILLPQEAAIFGQRDRRVFETNQAQESEEQLTDATGQTYQIATKRSLHCDAAGNIFLIGVIRDITERKRIEEELRRTTVELTRSNLELRLSQDRLHRLAYYDSLTGLANRKHFYESLQKSLDWAKQEQKLVGLLFIDLDGFKQVNDSWGHDFGDLLLKAVAGRVKNCLRGSDLVARLGGDEFTVILPGIKQPSDIEIVTHKILAALSQPFMLNDRQLQVAASVGSSIYPVDGETQGVLIKKADTAMYQVKQEGRDRKTLS
ncbi:MAG: CHASE2 domain-containing protein [Jaaginema sp. PMC 1079.18]|nr:CHASE2 domain-containing protein [Jaaginema sp. PMC 1080.18]MEC4850429.1 CHASE2 domain-containing protein [Jaaginema sp. PMC 1079.18]MEC4866550.1 CHASE2 domain-containing protein [Jaaginema sp. PMC 1078.18]